MAGPSFREFGRDFVHFLVPDAVLLAAPEGACTRCDADAVRSEEVLFDVQLVRCWDAEGGLGAGCYGAEEFGHRCCMYRFGPLVPRGVLIKARQVREMSTSLSIIEVDKGL